jgi:hypothetical protein
MAQSAAPQDCPSCGKPAPRILSLFAPKVDGGAAALPAQAESSSANPDSTSTGATALHVQAGEIQLDNVEVVGLRRGVVVEAGGKVTGDITTERCDVGVTASSVSSTNLKHTSRFDRTARKIVHSKKTK